MVKKKKDILTLGKRRSSIARAKVKDGTGKIIINGKSLENFQPEMAKLMIKEPILMAGDIVSKLDIIVNVRGGGVIGQAEAVRQSIARGLVNIDKKLEEKFDKYDVNLLVSDVRRNEPHKPSRSKQGPRRHKQRSKR